MIDLSFPITTINTTPQTTSNTINNSPTPQTAPITINNSPTPQTTPNTINNSPTHQTAPITINNSPAPQTTPNTINNSPTPQTTSNNTLINNTSNTINNSPNIINTPQTTSNIINNTPNIINNSPNIINTPSNIPITINNNNNSTEHSIKDETWVFGYGSLIYRPSFEFESKVTGFIKGWKRRFWQGSTDHRGVPGNPGRVVTLIPAEATYEVWGVCYKIPEEKKEQVLAYLDYREKGGYTREFVTVWTTSSNLPSVAVQKALLYTATSQNEEYLGPASIESLATQIRHSIGPSGPNYEYLFNLANSLRQLNIADKHIFKLEKVVLKLFENKEGTEKSSTISLIIDTENKIEAITYQSEDIE